MNDQPVPFLDSVTRRSLLKRGGQGALVMSSAGVLLAGCGSSGDSKTTTTTDTTKPVRGGTLTVGMITGGVAETLNTLVPVANVDGMRCLQLFDPLVGYEANDANTGVVLVPALATKWEPNATATVWTLTLRDGVTFHNGAAFSADDVVYTFGLWSDPATVPGASLAGVVDFKGVKKVDSLTVSIPLLVPLAEFPSMLSFSASGIVQKGTTAKDLSTKPIGTGPFMFKSFVPGKRSEFVRNPNWWKPGLPYLDTLIVDSSFKDETARKNALLGGQIDASGSLPPDVAKELQSSSQVKLLRSPGATASYMFMRVDKAPFRDVRVRQAMQLIADRPQLVANAQSGFATIGNDLLGLGCEFFAGGLKRAQDIEKAKSLLKAAGQEGLKVKLQTSDAAPPGAIASATLYAQQAKAAGVTVIVDEVSPDSYYTPAGGFLTRTFGYELISTLPSLTLFYRLVTTASAPYNDSHWGTTPETKPSDALFKQAAAAVDPTKAKELWSEVQQQQFEMGPYIVYANADNLDAVAPNVHGVPATFAGPMNYWKLYNAFITN